jgi:hypothetical protein
MSYTNGLDDPTIHFNTITWVGSGNSSRDFTGVGFAPDLVWVKNAGGSVAINHSLYDRVRGAGANKELVPNNTTAEGAENHDSYDYLSAFGSDGFSSTYAGNVAYYFNESGSNYVAWNWLAGNSTSSNSNGDLTSTVSVNQTAGFSIVSYTGNGTQGATVGHGLAIKPSWILVKRRDSTSDWLNYHSSLGATKSIFLNATHASGTYNYWNSTEPTSSVFEIFSSTSAAINASGGTYIAYCFAEKKGYSKFGSYTGNGNADGPFIYTGFKPAWFLLKNVSAAGYNWYIMDNKRDPHNPLGNLLLANTSSTTNTVSSERFDLLSNGFKVRRNDNGSNTSGSTYIYMAFAESPFVNSKGVPTNAR